MSAPQTPPPVAADDAAIVASVDSGEVEERRPVFESDAAAASFNAAVFAQLQQQSSALVADPAAASSAPVDDVALHTDSASNTNRHTVLCRFCDTKVLLSEASTYLRTEHSLHLLCGAKDDPTVETLSDWWVVPSQMNFENVGVTRAVDPAARYRYLTCANCDRGPIGINFLDEPTKFFVAHARVKYQQA